MASSSVAWQWQNGVARRAAATPFGMRDDAGAQNGGRRCAWRGYSCAFSSTIRSGHVRVGSMMRSSTRYSTFPRVSSSSATSPLAAAARALLLPLRSPLSCRVYITYPSARHSARRWRDE